MEHRKPSPEEILAALDDQALADEAERVRSLSDADVDRELAGAGFDAQRIRAEAQGVFESAMEKRVKALGEITSLPAPTGSRVIALYGHTRRRRVSRASAVWIAAAALAASVAFAITAGSPGVVSWWRAGPWGSGEAVGFYGQERAARLRGEAQGACAKAHWAACKASLDQARGIDPAGESAPGIRALRDAIDDARRGGKWP